MLAALGAAGCLDQTPLPGASDRLDTSVRALFVGMGAEGDAALRAATDAVADETGEVPRRWGVRRLPLDALAGLGIRPDADPAGARGLLLVNRLECTLEKLEQLLTNPEQSALYPQVWERSERTYTTDLEAYRARQVSTVWWQTVNAAKLVDAPYTQVLDTGLRYLPADAEHSDPALLERTVMQQPATFAGTTKSSLQQDYQLELFWERSPSELIHVYAVWRQMTVASMNLTTEDTALSNLVLSKLQEWDSKTEALCKQ